MFFNPNLHRCHQFAIGRTIEMSLTTPRYLPSYRRDELTLICDAAREGRSLCFVGIAGVGKSNVTNFLRFDPYDYKRHYLGDNAKNILFPFIDGNVWDRTPHRLWEQMLADVEYLTKDLTPPPADEKVVQLTNEQRALSALRNRIHWLTSKLQLQLMFILDDFDPLLRTGPLPMLEQLYTLRLAGNQNKLSYLIFTKRLPAILGRKLPLDDNAKFYELFKRDIYALRPYNHDDTLQMLLFLNENAGKPLRTKELVIIAEKLSGGHAGLAKVIFNLWRRDPPEEVEGMLHKLAGQADVEAECRRILFQLHTDEQIAARLHAQDKPADTDMLRLLAWRGLLDGEDDYRWFSPLLQVYLQR